MSASYRNPTGLPTCDVTVRRGFSSADSSLGISFITMATALSAALEPFPYNSETNKACVRRLEVIYGKEKLRFKERSDMSEDVDCCQGILKLLAEEKTHKISKINCELSVSYFFTLHSGPV